MLMIKSGRKHVFLCAALMLALTGCSSSNPPAADDADASDSSSTAGIGDDLQDDETHTPAEEGGNQPDAPASPGESQDNPVETDNTPDSEGNVTDSNTDPATDNGNGDDSNEPETPIEEPDPVDTETPVAEPTPVETETPVEAPTPDANQTPVDEPTPIETEAPVEEPTPVETDSPGSETDVDNTEGMLIPEIEAGGDLDRLMRGLGRQTARLLLDLNTRLSEGVELTEKQETCIGSYDPAVGEQLLSFDCESNYTLADGGSPPVYSSTAAYYDREDCHASLSSGNTDNCVLQRSSVSIPVEWYTPEGQTMPVPIAGIEIQYAVNSTILRIENAAAALGGYFLCELDLTDGNSTAAPGQSCQDIIEKAADRLDTVLPE